MAEQRAARDVSKLIPMTRFWFELSLSIDRPYPPGAPLGCGITAFNKEDAMALLRERVFKDYGEPQITRCVENIDVSTIRDPHIWPNMGDPSIRGVWFPKGF